MLDPRGTALLRCEVLSTSRLSCTVNVRALQADRTLDIAEGDAIHLMNNADYIQEQYGASTPLSELMKGETRTLLVQRVVMIPRLYWRDFLLLASPVQGAANGR